VIPSRRKRSAEHVAHMKRREARSGVRCGNLRKRDHLNNLGIDMSKKY
jgi:hypothetical protein